MLKSEQRPKLKIPKSRSEKVSDIIGYASFLGSVFFLIYIWGDLPDQVPAHYNALGEVNRWGSKWELTLLPAIAFIMLIFLQTLEKFPHTHNYPERLNESNAAEFYLNSRKLLNQIKNVCLLLFSMILFESILIALGWGGVGFGKWFLPVAIIGSVAPIIIAVLRQRKIK